MPRAAGPAGGRGRARPAERAGGQHGPGMRAHALRSARLRRSGSRARARCRGGSLREGAAAALATHGRRPGRAR
jgi:hypothetical protein